MNHSLAFKTSLYICCLVIYHEPSSNFVVEWRRSNYVAAANSDCPDHHYICVGLPKSNYWIFPSYIYILSYVELLVRDGR